MNIQYTLTFVSLKFFAYNNTAVLLHVQLVLTNTVQNVNYSVKIVFRTDDITKQAHLKTYLLVMIKIEFGYMDDIHVYLDFYPSSRTGLLLSQLSSIGNKTVQT